MIVIAAAFRSKAQKIIKKTGTRWCAYFYKPIILYVLLFAKWLERTTKQYRNIKTIHFRPHFMHCEHHFVIFYSSLHRKMKTFYICHYISQWPGWWSSSKLTLLFNRNNNHRQLSSRLALWTFATSFLQLSLITAFLLSYQPWIFHRKYILSWKNFVVTRKAMIITFSSSSTSIFFDGLLSPLFHGRHYIIIKILCQFILPIRSTLLTKIMAYLRLH